MLVANALLRDYSNFTYFYVTKLSCKTKPCKTVLNLNIHKVWVLSTELPLANQSHLLMVTVKFQLFVPAVYVSHYSY